MWLVIIHEFRTEEFPSRSHRISRAAANNPGQVAQSVERSPEKAGVGGSIPSLATIYSFLIHFASKIFAAARGERS